MTITIFPKTKRRTPVEFQAAYEKQYGKDVRKTLPWVVAVPAAVAGGASYWIVRSGADLNILGAFIVYLGMVAGLWIAFGPEKPKKSDGQEARELLDDIDKRGIRALDQPDNKGSL